MKRLVTIIMILFCGHVMACVCAKTETVKESFDRYPIIFHGRVIEKSIVLYSTTLRDEQLKSIRDKLKNDEKRLAGFEAEKVQKVTFQIIEIVKGDSITNTVTIFTSLNTSCDINFRKNKEYFVYGARMGFNDNKYLKYADNSNDFVKDNFYWTHFCTRTRLFNEQEKQELTKVKDR